MTRKSRRGTRVPTRTIPTTHTSSSPEREPLECERETETVRPPLGAQEATKSIFGPEHEATQRAVFGLLDLPLTAEERERRRHHELAGPWADELGMPIATASVVGDDESGDWDAWQYQCGIICLRGRDKRGVPTVGAGVISDTADAIVSLPPLLPIADAQGVRLYSHLLAERDREIADESRVLDLAREVKVRSISLVMTLEDETVSGELPNIMVSCSATSSTLPDESPVDYVSWEVDLTTEDIVRSFGDDKRDVGLHLLRAGYAQLIESAQKQLFYKAYGKMLDKMRERRSSERAATVGTHAN